MTRERQVGKHLQGHLGDILLEISRSKSSIQCVRTVTERDRYKVTIFWSFSLKFTAVSPTPNTSERWERESYKVTMFWSFSLKLTAVATTEIDNVVQIPKIHCSPLPLPDSPYNPPNTLRCLRCDQPSGKAGNRKKWGGGPQLNSPPHALSHNF
jgi:hypothetical protein